MGAAQMNRSWVQAQEKHRKVHEQVGVGLWLQVLTGSSLPMPTPIPDLPAGGNRITQEVHGAHDGGVFALCALRDGTLVSGGGRDRRVVLWGSDYSKVQEVEVRTGDGGWPGRYPTGLLTLDFPRARVIPPHLTCVLHTPLPTQVPEDFGPVRTVAEGRGDTLYVGTTRNCILLGSVHTGFSLLVQVSTAPHPHPCLQFSSHP